jgi:hypothetical protein
MDRRFNNSRSWMPGAAGEGLGGSWGRGRWEEKTTFSAALKMRSTCALSRETGSVCFLAAL